MNITDTIDPKVDQLTADHLIGRTMTICITDVRLAAGDQPCDIHYEGDAGLPYRPGKSMRRVLVHVWGGDVKRYIGRSMTLYRDDDVQFGGLKVGGLRISHMSDIKDAVTMALTAKKGSKKAFKVQPLKLDAPKVEQPKQDAPALALKLLAPDGSEFTAKSLAMWVEACKRGIAKMEDAGALARWRTEMAPHFMAAEHVDVGAVEHVQGLAQDRLDALADAAPASEPADEAIPF